MKGIEARSDWVDAFSHLLARSLELEAQWAPERPDEIRILGKHRALAGWSEILRRGELVAHLEGWPGPADLLVSWCDGVAGRPIPVAMVRNAKIWLLSGDLEAEGDKPAVDFDAWFERTFLGRFPLRELAETLRPVADDCWAAGALPERIEIDGFPYCLSIRDARDYALVGFAGYGFNSWACYFTVEREHARVRLRMPFGGVYMESREVSERLVREIGQVAAVLERCRGRLARVDIADNMGSMAFRYRRSPESPWVECAIDRCAENPLQAAVDLALGSG